MIITEQDDQDYDNATYVDLLKCKIWRVSYDFQHLAGYAYLPHMNCTDMGGCITFFERLDARVERIEVTHGPRLGPGETDTVYLRTRGKWEAIQETQGKLHHIKGLQ